MITRNCFGKLEPSIGDYYVSKSDRGYEVMKHEACYVTNAVLYNPVFLWTEIEPFQSLVQAYKFLKENVSNLL